MPTFGQVPAATRYVLKELGLMLFMALSDSMPAAA